MPTAYHTLEIHSAIIVIPNYAGHCRFSFTHLICSLRRKSPSLLPSAFTLLLLDTALGVLE